MLLCIPVHSSHAPESKDWKVCGVGGGNLSIVKLSDQFILFTKSVHPVYAESWTTCLQLQSM